MEGQSRRERERMTRRLYEASLSGRFTSLIELIDEDELILDRFMLACFGDTPLHIAAMLGHVEFAREILRRKPEFATELDTEGSSPLHLASAKGNLEMVKMLLSINPDVCSVTDQDGRTPLHRAAIKGRIDVMKELIQTRPEVIHLRVDRGENILHLCLKYNRLEALKLILELASDQEIELLNSKDVEGNTVLHLAAAKKQIKGIELLLGKNGIEVNEMNGSGFTALDILAQSPREMKDMDIGESLRDAGALRARDINHHNTTTGSSRKILQSLDKDKYEWLERKKNSLMVVSTVIATMAFQIVLSPPGGVWQEDVRDLKSPNYGDFIHKAGTSIMADRYPRLYTVLLTCSTLSFVGSLSTTLLLISGLPMKRRFFMWILMVSMWIIITSLGVAYYVSISQLIPEIEKFELLFNIMMDAATIWLGVVGLVFILHSIRLVLRYMSRLYLRLRIFIWTLIVLFTLSLLIMGVMRIYPQSTAPLSICVFIIFTIVSIWCGMVVIVFLFQIACLVVWFVKKCWMIIKQAGCYRYQTMNNNPNQSTV